MMESQQRQIIKSALLQHEKYEYPLPAGGGDWRVYLNVWQHDGQYWAQWRTVQNINNLEYFERSRRRRFRTKDEAVNWLYGDYDAPWKDLGQELRLSGPVPRPGR